MTINERINALRKLMKENGIDAYLIDNADHHSSEYVSNYFKERTFMSSFDGSNGKMLVTLDKSYLWTDGRYFLQAELDLKNTEIKLMKMDTDNTPSLLDFIKTELNGKVLGFDGTLVSSSFGKALDGCCTIKANKNLVSSIYTTRGELEFSHIWPLDKKLSGEARSERLSRVREEMKKRGATSHILTSLDDIAWLLNLRGNDIPITPVFLSFLYINLNEAVLFCMSASVDEDVKKALKRDKVKIQEYSTFLMFINDLKDEKILLSPSTMNYSYLKILSEKNEIIEGDNPTLLMKAIKNKVEIKNNRLIHEYDGLAVFRFMKYIKERYAKGLPISEYPMAEKVLEFRQRCDKFYEVSFDSIASWNSNGAIIHYEPTKESSMDVSGTGFFLLDSGGQYMGGTTDITRTIELGEISKEMKHHYTMVLKGLINVSRAKFISGSSGQNIDMLAREPFWAEGLDYRHGTGHGVGYMLNVHEGPQGIRYKKVVERNDSSLFRPGMVTSIEPGIYLAGKYGIRLENEILCQEDSKTEWGDFYSFETLTICPFDLDPVLKEELTKDEKKWLNDYHKMVYRKLSKLCDESELETLKQMTRRI